MAGTADAPRNGGTHAALDDNRQSEGDGLAELRSLIVGPEHELLGSLKARLDNPATRTADVSEVLADAIVLRGKDQHLARALAPTLEDAITASVRRNPRPLADALFPVMGPAIRKAIAHTLAGMMESFNRTRRAQRVVARGPVAADRAAAPASRSRNRAARHAHVPRRAGVPDPSPRAACSCSSTSRPTAVSSRTPIRSRQC